MLTDQHIVDLAVRVLPSEVLRMMGRPGRASPDQKYLDLVNRFTSETASLVRPKGVYTIRTVQCMTDQELALEGGPRFHGPVAGFLEPATRIAVSVVTIGPDLERLSRRSMSEGNLLEGFILDAIGSAAVDAAADMMIEFLRRHEMGSQEELTPPFSPGYCGMSVREQESLFEFVDAGAIGVSLTESCFMQPLKSISALIGIGEAQRIVARGSPCQWCDLTQCKMRRA